MGENLHLCFKHNAVLTEDLDQFLNACNLDSKVLEATVANAFALAAGLLDSLNNDVNAEKEYYDKCAFFCFFSDFFDLLETEDVCVEINSLLDVLSEE